MFKKINEEFQQLLELEISPSLKDTLQGYEKRHRDGIQDRIQDEQEQIDREIERNGVASGYTISSLNSLKQSLKSASTYSQIFKDMYDSLKVDLNTAKITEIDVPKTSKELTAKLDDCIVLFKVKKNEYQSKYDFNRKHFVLADKGRMVRMPNNNIFTTDVFVKGKVLDLRSSATNLARAINGDAFDQAWIIENAEATLEKRSQRSDRKHKRVNRTTDNEITNSWYGAADYDKSGYEKRDINKELEASKQKDRSMEIELLKQELKDIEADSWKAVTSGKYPDLSFEDWNTFLNEKRQVLNAIADLGLTRNKSNTSINKAFEEVTKKLDELKQKFHVEEI